MVSIGELVVIISFIWLLLIVIANRVDLQQFGLLVSSGFLLYIPSIFSRFVTKLAGPAEKWETFGKYAQLPTFILFLTLPLLLSINLIKGIFFTISPIFNYSVIELLRLETFLLILPVLAIFLSVQMLITGIFDLLGGKELDRAGLLVVGIILTFFTQTKGEGNRSHKIKAISVLVVVQLLMVVLAVPVSTGVQNGMDGLYEDSQGAIITVIYPNSPAADSNLAEDMVISLVQVFDGNLAIFERNITSSSQFKQALAQIPSNTPILLTIDGNLQYTITSAEPPEEFTSGIGSYLGLRVEDYKPPKFDFLPTLLPFWTDIFFDWVLNIGLLFGMYNLLPLPRSYGYTLMEEFSERFGFDFSERGKQIISYLFLGVLAGNILYYVL